MNNFLQNSCIFRSILSEIITYEIGVFYQQKIKDR